MTRAVTFEVVTLQRDHQCVIDLPAGDIGGDRGGDGGGNGNDNAGANGETGRFLLVVVKVFIICC
jgi:hypothetical protein